MNNQKKCKLNNCKFGSYPHFHKLPFVKQKPFNKEKLVKLANKIKERESWEKEIRQICTYYSEFGEGTAGYSLSEEQFTKLFALIRSERQKAREEERGKVIEEWKIKLKDMKKYPQAKGYNRAQFNFGYNLALIDILDLLSKELSNGK